MDAKEIMNALAAPFPPEAVKWKPGVISKDGNKCLAMHYVDARMIQERLDQVMGIDGWQDDYEECPDGSAICRLRLKINGEWIQKCDVGSQSEQPDAGDRKKAAVSDALKRAAVKFGVGRYLYAVPAQWVAYDPQKRAIKERPRLPASSASRPEGNGKATITLDQAQDLAKLIKASGLNHRALLAYYRVPGLLGLPVIHLESARAAIADRGSALWKWDPEKDQVPAKT